MEKQSYLITLLPLGPFFFGGEHNFNFGEHRRQTQQRYYLISENKPAQTTCLGALRYGILAASNALITDFADTEQQKRAARLVGANSFHIKEAKSFGAIGQLSPLFIQRATGERLIPTPKNHQKSQFSENEPVSYTPFVVKPCPENTFSSAGGGLAVQGYQPKFGCGGGWLQLDTRKVYADSDIFCQAVQVGIHAHRTDGVTDRDQSFFKKERRQFRHSGDAFCFFAQLDTELLEGTMSNLQQGVPVYLGQNQSPFLLKAERQENDLTQQIQASLGQGYTGLPFYYAASDCLGSSPQGFFAADSRPFRYITTDLTAGSYYKRLQRSQELYRLFQAGAVFYGEQCPMRHEICEQIGMNQLILIGGTGHEN